MNFARAIARMVLWIAVVFLIWTVDTLHRLQARRKKADPFALAYGDVPAVPNNRPLKKGQRSNRGNGSESLEKRYLA